MKKLFLILIPFVFLSCSNNFWTGKQNFTFKNKTNRSVTIYITDEDNLHLKPGKEATIAARASAKFTVDSYLRCKLNYNYDNCIYDVIDSTGNTITVYNNSTKDIMLGERKGSIGTYQELEAAAASQGKSVSDIEIEKKIDAGSSVTFVVFSDNPKYYAYYCDNKITVPLSILSFN